MNKKRAQQIFNALNKASKQALQKKKFSFSSPYDLTSEANTLCEIPKAMQYFEILLEPPLVRHHDT